MHTTLRQKIEKKTKSDKNYDVVRVFIAFGSYSLE